MWVSPYRVTRRADSRQALLGGNLKKLVAASLVGILALTACAPVAKDARYNNVADLGGAVSSVTGTKCGDGAGLKSMQDNGWDQDNCGDDLSLGVFTDSSTQRSVLVKNPPEPGRVLLEGPNWIIWTNQDNGDTLREKLGGNFKTDPGALTVYVNLDLKSGVLWVSRTQTTTGKWCYGSGGTLMKDLGPDGVAYLNSSSGMSFTGKLAESRAVGDACRMTYRIDDVVAGDGPYDVQVGGRKAGSYSEAQLRAGLDLKVG